MKKIFYTLLTLVLAISANAQLTNNGATIIVEDGATLFIESNLVNNTTGSIDIQGSGIIEVQGNINIASTSTVTMNDNAKLVLSGATGSTITSGGATFTNVEMDKTAENVTLLDQMRISQDLNFVGDNNKIILGDNNLVLAPMSTITSADANEYIIADGAANTGVVSRELTADEVFTFHIGDATNYTPLMADVEGSAYSSATVDVNTVPNAQVNVPAEATDYINRYWNVDATGITDLDATLTGTYVTGDLETGSTPGDVKGAHYGAEWTYFDAAAGTDQVIGRIEESGDFTGTNSFGKVGLTVFLQGAYSGGTMTTSLNSANLIPLTSPYDGTTTVASIPANVTDWIEIEVRDATTPGTVLKTQSAFLRNDGVVLDLQGNPNPLLLDAPATGYISINHRNHLSISTANTLNLGTVGFDSHDFSTGLAQAFDDAAVTTNDAMVAVGSDFAMIRGNVQNTNDFIRVSGPPFINDGAALLSFLGGFTNVETSMYSQYDVNLDGTIRASGPPFINDAAMILSTLGSFTSIFNTHKY